MCGIAGMLGTPDAAALDRMLVAISRRGPDSLGTYEDPGRLAMGMRRLAVLDVTASGNQPMHGAGGNITIVYNGETYNFRQLRTQLMAKGHRFASQTDTEVVLRLYEEYGDDFLRHLDGMYALAIYDRRGGPGKERLILARDPMGIKPLLWTVQGGRIIFASEMKAMLASGLVAPHVNPDALWLLLHKGSLPQPLTMLRDVNMLMPGHLLIADANGVVVQPYWTFTEQAVGDVSELSPEEMVVWLRHIFKKTISSQSVSDVPVGAWLSGGIDSALTSAFLARSAGSRLRTFSLGVDPAEAEGCFDETALAETTAQFIGTNHSTLRVNGALMDRLFDDFVIAIDQPSVDGVNSYLISRLTREHVTVVLSGTGGDELFAGYPWFLAMQAAGNLSTDEFSMYYDQQYYIYPADKALTLLAPGMIGGLKDPSSFFRRMTSLPDELPQVEPVGRTSAMCLRSYTQNQLLRDIDTVSMHHSLEVRVPFLGLQMVRAALALPPAAKLDPLARPGAATYREAGSKKILFALGAGLVPPDIVDRPKRGFGLPFRNWLLGPMRARVRAALLDSWPGTDDGYLRRRAVEEIWHDFVADKAPWHHVWLLLVLRSWARENGVTSS